MRQLLKYIGFKLSCLAAALLLVSCLPRWAEAQNDSGFKFLEVKVVDPEGKPLPDVPVDIRIDGSEFPMPTNEEGILAFNIPTSNKTRLRLKVNHPGYATLAASWNSGEDLPETYTIRMQKGSTIGGIIQDKDGEPIEGVKIEATLASSSGMRGGGKLRPLLSGVIATTDSEGRWRYESAPSKRVDILTDFMHPEYAHDNIFGYRAGSWEQLHSLKHVVVLLKGLELRGQVLDPDGLPVVRAKVTLSKGRYYSDEKATVTDNEGNYSLSNVKPSQTTITVLSSDWAPETKNLETKTGMEPIDFQLQPGRLVRFRITDQSGQPVEGVRITPDEWRGLEILPTSAQKTNEKGIWEWELAPVDKIQYRIGKKGFMSTSVADVVPRDEVYEITIPPQLVFTGNVTDAETGKPIDKFQVVEGIYWRETDDDVVWQQHRKEAGSQGQYRVAYNSGYAGFKIKIEADGYHPKASRLVAIDEGQVSIDLELEAGTGPSGIVKLPAGQPAAGAEVLMGTMRARISLHNGEHNGNSRVITTTTDLQGRFSLPIPEGSFSLVCLHEEGWATLLEAEESQSDFEFTLEAWARLEGVVLQGKEGLANEQVSLWYPRQEKRMGSSYVQWNYRALTHEQGDFVFPRVRAGTATLQRNIPFGQKTGRRLGTFSSHAQPCELIAGKTAQVQIGGTGRPIAGRMIAPEDYPGEVPWLMGRVHLNYSVKKQQVGKPATKQQIEEAEKGTYQRYAAAFSEDGSFEIHDVLPGKYWLNAVVYQPLRSRNFNWNEIGRLKTEITIPELKEKNDQDLLDLGEFTLEIVPEN